MLDPVHIVLFSTHKTALLSEISSQSVSLKRGRKWKATKFTIWIAVLCSMCNIFPNLLATAISVVHWLKMSRVFISRSRYQNEECHVAGCNEEWPKNEGTYYEIFNIEKANDKRSNPERANDKRPEKKAPTMKDLTMKDQIMKNLPMKYSKMKNLRMVKELMMKYLRTKDPTKISWRIYLYLNQVEGSYYERSKDEGSSKQKLINA